MVKKLFVFLILAAICNTYAQPKADFSIAAEALLDPVLSSSESTPESSRDLQAATTCTKPFLLTGAFHVRAQDVEVAWMHPNGENGSYEIEYGPFGFITGTGIQVTTNGLSYQIPEESLQRGVMYHYQIRAICAGNATSEWSARRYFQTIPVGGHCDEPLVVPPLPYSHESNTLFYNNRLEGNSACGTIGYDGNYLEALSVVYKYTADHTGSVNISMNPFTRTFTGIFVYGSCETIGQHCLASVANREATIRNIVLNVVTGQDYYIVLSSRDLTFNYQYQLTIEKSGCPAPTALQGTVTDLTTASISWTAANPAATQWQIGLQPADSGIPVSGDSTQYFTATTPNYGLSGLSMRTNYQYWVREKCPNSNLYSNWAGPFTFTTPLCKPEYKCNVTFHLSDLGGNGWQGLLMEVVQEGFVVATLGESLTGSSTVVTVPICTGVPFSVRWKTDDDTFHIGNWSDAYFTHNLMSQIRLTIKNQFNQVLFEMPSNVTPSFNFTLYTGVVNCGSLSCAPPTNLMAVHSPVNGTTFTWSANQTPATRWEIYVGNWDERSYYSNPHTLAQFVPTYSTIGNETTYTATNVLMANHEYYFIVRPVCLGIPGNWSVPKKFSTNSTGVCYTTPLQPILVEAAPTSLSFGWENNGASAWEVVLQPVYSGVPQSSGIVVNDNYYTALGLIPKTAYELYVRSICGDVTGDWERVLGITREGVYDPQCKWQMYAGGVDLRQQLIMDVYHEVFREYRTRGTVPQGFNPPSLRQLVPFLAVSNPGIYDFVATGAESGYNMISFSYEANVHPEYPDFKITTTFEEGFLGLGQMTNFDMLERIFPFYADQAYLNEAGLDATFENGVGTVWVKKIDFCNNIICTETFSEPTSPFEPYGYWSLETGFWRVLDNGVDQLEQWWHESSANAYLGERSAICKGTTVLPVGQISEEWLLSPRKHINANEKMRFLTRQGESKEFNTKFEIRVCTSVDPSNAANFETIKVYTENELMLNEETNVQQLHTVYQQKLVDLSAYNGQSIHIAFVKVFESTPGDRRSDDWFIDNVQIVKPCAAVSNIRITNVAAPYYFSVIWDANGSTNWDIQYGPVGFPLGSGTIVNNLDYREFVIDGISTNFDIYIRSRCNGCAGYTGSWIKWERCVAPSDMIVTQLSTTSASISWEAGPATSWQIVIIPANTGVPSSGGVTVYEPFYTATNLNPNIDYDVFIRANCNNGQSGYSNMGVIDLVPDTIPSCALSNTNSNYIKHLVLELINDVIAKSQLPGWVSQNYTSTYLLALRPYILDATPGIYNFRATPTSISFDFTQNDQHYVGNSDVRIEATSISGGYVDFDLDMYVNSIQRFAGSLYNENGANGNFYVRHINFCPDTLIECLSHVAIVVDESGSISSSERSKIKTQLRNFIQQQAAYNDTHNSNIHISIIGMSDADINNRTDHVRATALRGKITSDNENDYISWINNYGTRTNVSASSDFWNSGLSIALGLTFKPDVVVMITDGAQAEKPETLINTLKKFNNFRDPQNPENPLKPNGPHLYVIGIENGYYIGKNTPGIIMTREEDPNYNESAVSNNKVSTTLTTSLKYLLGYPDEPNMFPLKSIRDFTQDYFGHEDFLLFTDDLTYITDNLRRNNTPRQLIPYICGTESVKDVCDDCYSFKPEPGKEYLLSAWVMEQHNIQVETYKSPKIRLLFYRNNEAVPNDEILDKTVVCEPSGDIIEGWQRIVKKFTIPQSSAPEQNTIVMGIELENSDEGIPVYFDDIRIHPIDGSMKSFVYDPETFKLLSELDENNYATFYEYDNEGGLVRVKKETSRGVKTIQETRSGKVINVNQN